MTAEISALEETNKQFELLQCSWNVDPKKLTFEEINEDSYPNFWTLFFDGSKSKEGARDGCILTNPQEDKRLITCWLEFECTNNTAENGALIQGLKKIIDLNIKILKLFRDSIVMTHQASM